MNARRPLYCTLVTLMVALAGCSAAPPTADTRHAPPAKAKAARQEALKSLDAPQTRQPQPPAPPPVVDEATARLQPLRTMAFASGGVAMAAPGAPYWQAPVDRENYTHYTDNPVHRVSEQPVSTFGLDVDTGSYTNVRRMLEQGRLPPADAVRAEEFINYFEYGYPIPTDRTQPFTVTTEVAPAPWNPQRRLLLIGVQGYRVPASSIPAANLVFLVDTSGSMNEPDKLPLLKAALKQLVPQLRHRDHVAIVTYAGNAGVALPSTPGDQQARIDAAIDAMDAGGSTNGGAGIELAYAQAEQHFVKGGVNRVILATDGDFNVGTTGIEALKDIVADRRRSGIALDTLGFGEGNYNDAMAVQLADVGNGSHHYIDNLSEAHRVLVDSLSSTLLTIAGDVKVQVEFNPARVEEYRLIGYVKRVLRREDFNNDRVDSGDIGAGANVTALYEITPAGSGDPQIDPLRYGHRHPSAVHGGELAWLRLRYKLPGHTHSTLVQRAITQADDHEQPSRRLRFAAAVAAFADALRGGTLLDGYTLHQVADLARGARGDDPRGQRAAFVQLVELAGSLQTPAPGADRATALRRR